MTNGFTTAVKQTFSMEKMVLMTLAGIVSIVATTLTVWFTLQSTFVSIEAFASENKKQDENWMRHKKMTACNQAKNNRNFLNIELNTANRELARLSYEAETRTLSNLERQRKIQLEQDVARMIIEVSNLSKEVLEQCRVP